MSPQCSLLYLAQNWTGQSSETAGITELEIPNSIFNQQECKLSNRMNECTWQNYLALLPPKKTVAYKCYIAMFYMGQGWLD
jgi:glutamine cyclotransferase